MLVKNEPDEFLNSINQGQVDIETELFQKEIFEVSFASKWNELFYEPTLTWFDDKGMVWTLFCPLNFFFRV